MYNNVFSEFQIAKQYVRLDGADEYVDMRCVGTCTQELDVKTVTKSCAGVITERVTMSAGTGTLTMTLHMPYALWTSLFGMERDGLATGVYAYGTDSRHVEFALTQKVLDETGDVLLKAYPRCIFDSVPSVEIENGAEEVAEIEAEIALLADDDGEVVYQCLLSDATDIDEDTWLTAFGSDYVQATA